MDSISPNEAIASLASRQHGVVSTAQLRQAGLSRAQIHHRVSTGSLHRIHRGVFSVGYPVNEHRARATAALLACGRDALLSHRTAAIAWELLPERGSLIDVSVCGRNARSRPGIRVHRITELAPVYRRRHRGLLVVSPSLALLGVAATESSTDLEHAFNEALLLRLVSEASLKELTQRFHGHRGLKRLLPLMHSQDGDGFSRHATEKRLRELLKSAGFPPPRRNERKYGFELDFYWPDVKLNVEMDGYRWHSTKGRLNRDRDRDLDLQARGVRVQRVSYDQLHRPARLVAKLGATYALAARAAEAEQG